MLRHIILLTTLIVSASIQAETRYITDQLEVTQRSGQSTKHQILRMLPSGMAVELLETDSESRYSKVRTAKGTEGWVLSQYLDKQPSGRDRLASIQQQIEKYKTENIKLNKSLKEISDKLKKQDKQQKTLSKAKSTLEREMVHLRKISNNPLALEEENRSLKERIKQLDEDFQASQQEMTSLRDTSSQDWFLIGAGVILAGMIIGLLIPKIRWRRKSSWSSL